MRWQLINQDQNIGTGQNSIKGRWSSIKPHNKSTTSSQQNPAPTNATAKTQTKLSKQILQKQQQTNKINQRQTIRNIYLNKRKRLGA